MKKFKQDKSTKTVKNLIRNMMVRDNQEDSKLFFKKQLLKDDGKFHLAVVFKNK